MLFSQHTKIEIFIEDFYLLTIVTGATVFSVAISKKGELGGYRLNWMRR